MARSDLLVSLVRSGTVGDQLGFRRAAEALIAEESSKQHSVLASKLAEALKSDGGPPRIGPSPKPHGESQLVYEVEANRSFSDLTLPAGLEASVREIVEEHHRHELLRSYGLEPRHRIMLVGPPGSGKTSLAEAIAAEIMAPLLVVRYESLITSYLGETAGRLDALFEAVRSRPCVLFFDEFETIAKERGDTHESGEIKRVVSSLLLQIDRLPSYVVAVVASNHPELLDRAVWRRFQARLTLPQATRAGVVRFLDQWSERTNTDLGYAHRTIAEKLAGASFAEVEEFVTTIQRQDILRGPETNTRVVVKSVLDQWKAQANRTT